MPRGGSRPGAGRKTDPNSARSKARAAKEAAGGFTAPGGEKKPTAPAEWPFGRAAPIPPLTAAVPPGPATAPIENEQPLDVLLRLMREAVDPRMQLQAAMAAAPYLHAKAAPLGKKEARGIEAKKAGGGKFGAGAPPTLVVNNRG